MAGRIDHTIIAVNRYEQACRFYSWLMPKVGYPNMNDYGVTRGWAADSGSFWIKQAGTQFATDTFHKDRVGLCEIAFRADDRAQIDELAQGIEANGGTILDPPREYDYVPGYYAVFFADPDGIKLELVHMP
ncbi:MAG: VOC family protein [Deltaproteobacteria bacterium]|nr:VOC family protein [Deltaproteobacteria bacterium]